MKKDADTLSDAQNIASKLSESVLDGAAENAKGRLRIPSKNGISALTEASFCGRAPSGFNKSRFLKFHSPTVAVAEHIVSFTIKQYPGILTGVTPSYLSLPRRRRQGDRTALKGDPAPRSTSPTPEMPSAGLRQSRFFKV